MAKKIIRKSVCSTAAAMGFIAFLLLVGLAGGIDTKSASPDAAYPAMTIAIVFMAICILLVNVLGEGEK